MKRWSSLSFLCSVSMVRGYFWAQQGPRQHQNLPSLGGDNSCRCLRPEQLDAIDLSDVVVSEGSLDVSLEVDFSTFGFGCRAHNLQRAACQCGNGNRDCSSSALPTWCPKEWCWVDPRTCQLKHNQWIETVSATQGSRARYYSYATCWNDDTYTSDALKWSLAHQKLRFTYVTNTLGHLVTSSVSQDETMYAASLETVGGPAVDFMAAAAERGKFQIEVRSIPDLYRNRSMPFGSSDDDYCIYAASLGIVDACVGSFLLSRRRSSMTKWMILGLEHIRLVISSEDELAYSQDSTTTVLLPMTRACWIFILVFAIPVLGGLLFLIHEHGQSGSIFPRQEAADYVDQETGSRHGFRTNQRSVPLWRHIVRAVFNAALGALQRGYRPRLVTLGAKINLIGFSFFILTLISVYTANLAAILSARHAKPPVSTLQDILDGKLRICATREVYEVVKSQNDVADFLFAVDPPDLGGDGKPGFHCRNCQKRIRVFDYLDPTKAQHDSRYCHVGLALEQDLLAVQSRNCHCNKTIVGSTFGSVALGIPVFDRISKKLLAVLQELKNEGLWLQLNTREDETPSCEMRDANTEQFALRIPELSGIWVVSFGFAAMGLVVSCCMRIASSNGGTCGLSFRIALRFLQRGDRAKLSRAGYSWITNEYSHSRSWSSSHSDDVTVVDIFSRARSMSRDMQENPVAAIGHGRNGVPLPERRASNVEVIDSFESVTPPLTPVTNSDVDLTPVASNRVVLNPLLTPPISIDGDYRSIDAFDNKDADVGVSLQASQAKAESDKKAKKKKKSKKKGKKKTKASVTPADVVVEEKAMDEEKVNDEEEKGNDEVKAEDPLLTTCVETTGGGGASVTSELTFETLREQQATSPKAKVVARDELDHSVRNGSIFAQENPARLKNASLAALLEKNGQIDVEGPKRPLIPRRTALSSSFRRTALDVVVEDEE